MLTRIRNAFHAFTRNSPMFDAAGAGTRLATWAPPSSDFASIVSPSILRTRARDAYRNNPWARRAIDVITVSTIGAGIKPQFKTPAPQSKIDLQRAWLTWTDEADAAGVFDFYGLQQAALKAALVDGECFVRLVINPAKRIPLELQLLTAEYLLDTARTNDRTSNGIEYDEAGRRVAYWLFQRHPSQMGINLNSIRVPASEIIHLYSPIQPGQERGVTWLAPALTALRELQEFCEASLVRQKVGSLFAGFVRTADGSNPLTAAGGLPTLEPGAMVRLMPGEDVNFTEPPDSGNTYADFVRTQLRSISSALNLPYELLSGDLSQVTFASGRHALLEFRRQLESIQHHLMVFQFCRSVLLAWFRYAVAAGVLPDGAEKTEVRWVAPLPEMLDSRGEVGALIQKVRAGFMSRSEAVSLAGLDADALDLEIAADNARADRLGLVLDSDPRKTTLQGLSQSEPTSAPDNTEVTK